MTRDHDATVTITAFESSPDRGQGLARDMQVRWALEEAGQPYDVRLVSFDAMKAPAHVARQPFGQIPTLEEGGLTLFETGAIILHVAERHGGLLPADLDARARAISWMFAAVSTIEPPIMAFAMALITERDTDWFAARQPMLIERVHDRLRQLAARLGDADWLDGDFSAGDLMMIAVLRRLKNSGLLNDHPKVAAYVARGEARPAFRRAFDAQLAVFTAQTAAAD